MIKVYTTPYHKLSLNAILNGVRIIIIIMVSHFLPFTGPDQKKVGGTKRKLPPPSRYFLSSCIFTLREQEFPPNIKRFL